MPTILQITLNKPDNFITQLGDLNPVIEYRFDEPGGPSATGLINYGSAGTVGYQLPRSTSGTVTRDQTGGDANGSTAMLFDADGAFGDNTSPTTTAYQSITTGSVIFAFNKSIQANTDHLFVAENFSGFFTFSIESRSDGRIEVNCFEGAVSQGWTRISNSDVTDGNWHIGVIVQEGNSTVPTLYIDGVVDQLSPTGSLPNTWFADVASSWQRICMGGRLATPPSTASLQAWDGLIDYFAITEVEMTATQVSNLSDAYLNG